MSRFKGFESIPGWYKDKGPERDVVISSRIRLSRNLSGYKFPDKLSFKEEDGIRRIIVSAFESSRTGGSYEIMNMKELLPVERLMLFEKKLISRDFSEGRDKSVVIRKDNRLSCMINESDHLKISAYAGGLNLDELFSEIRELDEDLEKTLDYAVSLEFGYLNSLIKNSGTGMKASVMLHLPFLSRTGLLDRAIKTSLTEDFSVKGVMGDDDTSLGDLYQISNEISIGIGEDQYIGNLGSIVSSLIEYERRAREQFFKSKSMEFEDIFYRSYGILKHCRLLPLKEAVRYLMDFRIGIIMGWSDIPIERLDSLIVLAQKAHIQYTLDDDEETNSKILDYTRSQLVKTYLELLQ